MSFNENAKVIESTVLSHGSDRRFVVINEDTGEILDDAQGYGYRSVQKAWAAYRYKNRSPEEKKAAENKKAVVRDFCRQHKSFCRDVDAARFYAMKDNETFTAKDVTKMLREAGYGDIGFTGRDFLKYYDN